jgi:sulfoxide reductase heme-binding subunit YedZ
VTPVVAAVGSSSQVLWYATRGTGLVALVLLTLTLVLGVSQVVRYAPAGWPRFVVNGLHRNASLLALLLLAVHVLTTVLDTYVHVGVWAVFVPFIGTYHPLTLGLGAIALDLMVAVVISSLLRERIGYNAWRLVHWASYACWPVALVHGLGIGTDRHVAWVLLLNAVCVVVVVAAVVWRLAARPARRAVTARRRRGVPAGRSW